MKSLFKLHSDSDLITSLSPNPPPPLPASTPSGLSTKKSYSNLNSRPLMHTSQRKYSLNTFAEEIAEYQAHPYLRSQSVSTTVCPLNVSKHPECLKTQKKSQENAQKPLASSATQHQEQGINMFKNVFRNASLPVTQGELSDTGTIKVPEFSPSRRFRSNTINVHATPSTVNTLVTTSLSPTEKEKLSVVTRQPEQVGKSFTPDFMSVSGIPKRPLSKFAPHVSLLDPISPLSPITLQSHASVHEVKNELPSPALTQRNDEPTLEAKTTPAFEPFDQYLAKTIALMDRSPKLMSSSKWFLPSPTLEHSSNEKNKRLSKSFLAPKLPKRQSSLPLQHSPDLLYHQDDPLSTFPGPSAFTLSVTSPDLRLISDDMSESTSRGASTSSMFDHGSNKSSLSSNEAPLLFLEQKVYPESNLNPLVYPPLDSEKLRQYRLDSSASQPYNFEYRQEKSVETAEVPRSTSPCPSPRTETLRGTQGGLFQPVPVSASSFSESHLPGQLSKTSHRPLDYSAEVNPYLEHAGVAHASQKKGSSGSLNKELPSVPPISRPEFRRGRSDSTNQPTSYYEWDAIHANLSALNSNIGKWSQQEQGSSRGQVPKNNGNANRPVMNDWKTTCQLQRSQEQHSRGMPAKHASQKLNAPRAVNIANMERVSPSPSQQSRYNRPAMHHEQVPVRPKHVELLAPNSPSSVYSSVYSEAPTETSSPAFLFMKLQRSQYQYHSSNPDLFSEKQPVGLNIHAQQTHHIDVISGETSPKSKSVPSLLFDNENSPVTGDDYMMAVTVVDKKSSNWKNFPTASKGLFNERRHRFMSTAGPSSSAPQEEDSIPWLSQSTGPNHPRGSSQAHAPQPEEARPPFRGRSMSVAAGGFPQSQEESQHSLFESMRRRLRKPSINKLRHN